MSLKRRHPLSILQSSINSDVLENNIDGPQEPAKRIKKACDQCRAKKNRCDGTQPSCQACTIADLYCTYGIKSKKRGLPTGYVRILEALWALVFATIPKSTETTLQLLQDSHVIYDADDKATLQSGYISEDESLRRIWRESPVRARIEHMVARIEKEGPITLRARQATRNYVVHGKTIREPLKPPSNNWGVPSTHSSRHRTSTDDDTATWQTRGGPTEGSLFIEGSDVAAAAPVDDDEMSLSLPVASASLNLGPEPTSPTLPGDSWELIDIYSQYINCWFPVLPKHELVRMLSISYDGLACGYETSLLWAVFAMSSAIENRPRAPNETAHDSQGYYREARSLIPLTDDTDSLEHVQAILLLAMVDMTEERWASASILVGTAVRALLICDANPLLVNGTGLSIKRPGGMFGRLLLAAFCLDTLVSAALHTLPHLRSEDIRGTLDIDVSGPEEWEQWFPTAMDMEPCCSSKALHRPVRALSTFKELVKLLQILNDAVCCSAPNLNDYDLSGNHANALSLWLSQLPRHCLFTTPNSSLQSDSDLLPPVANLYVFYENVLLYLQSSSHLGSSDLSEPSLLAKRAYTRAFGAFPWKVILKLDDKLPARAHSSSSSLACKEIPGADDPRHNMRATSGKASGASRILSRQNSNQIRAKSLSLAHQPELHNSSDQSWLSFSSSVNETYPATDLGSALNQSVFENLDDLMTMQRSMEDLSPAQPAGVGEISSQFMYDLGFFDGISPSYRFNTNQ